MSNIKEYVVAEVIKEINYKERYEKLLKSLAVNYGSWDILYFRCCPNCGFEGYKTTEPPHKLYSLILYRYENSDKINCRKCFGGKEGEPSEFYRKS